MSLDLGPLPKISNFVYENIPNMRGQGSKSETLLVPSILNKGYSTCVNIVSTSGIDVGEFLLGVFLAVEYLGCGV